MENKYYTPEIEEFHVGFNYENKNFGKWINTIYDGMPTLMSKSYYDDCGCEYIAVEDDIKDSLVRVKYLDKEDIESLGFVLQIVELGQDTNINELGIFKKGDDSCYGTYFSDNVHGEKNIELFNTYFYIKNKSELKILLKQLGI